MREQTLKTIATADDFAAVRENWATGKAAVVITDRDQANHIQLPGQDIAVLVSGADSAGQMAIFEIVAQPGGGALPHQQTRDNEYWYIVEGQWEVLVGEQQRNVGPGSMVLVPACTIHNFRLLGDTPGKMLTINAPAGHELFFKSLADAFASGTPATDPVSILKDMARFDTVFEPLR